MLADPTECDIVVRELARTYNTPRYSDPWDSVQDYRRVRRYCADHPHQKSQAVSTALDLPRERIRGWVDSNTKPDCVHAIDTAEQSGWLITSWDSDEAHGLNILAAWILSSGSLASDPLRPRWIADGRRERLLGAAEAANITLEERSTRDRPNEWVPKRDASVLGRLLYLWTGLRGDKTPLQTRFPRYPGLAPQHVVKTFASTYLQNRGHVRDDTDDRRIQINEHRTDQYRNDLVELLKRATSSSDGIRGDSWPIYIVGAAIDDFADSISTTE